MPTYKVPTYYLKKINSDANSKFPKTARLIANSC